MHVSSVKVFSSSIPELPAAVRKPKRVRACCERAFTLVEMLATVVGLVMVLSAATGFMLTVCLRQAAVLEAQRLEELHDGLAQTMGKAIKTADAFQIYPDRAHYHGGQPSSGSRTGNFLVCLNTDADGLAFETDFEWSGEVMICTEAAGGVVRRVRTYPHTRPAPGASGLFNMDLGLVQATWEVETRLDLIAFHVCAMPLVMR